MLSLLGLPPRRQRVTQRTRLTRADRPLGADIRNEPIAARAIVTSSPALSSSRAPRARQTSLHVLASRSATAPNIDSEDGSIAAAVSPEASCSIARSCQAQLFITVVTGNPLLSRRLCFPDPKGRSHNGRLPVRHNGHL